MTGHALPFVADALARQASRGITTMLPTDRHTQVFADSVEQIIAR